MQQALGAVGDLFGNVLGGLGRSVERSLTALFGSSNARYIKKLQPKVAAINDLEPKYQAMSDDELRQQTDRFKERLAQGQTLDDLLIEAFAVCREASRRYIGLRHYDVQLIGGMVLHSGAIAEMATGEGKTLVATLPSYLNALSGKGVHVVTVNSYLARRDMEWMGPVHMGLGLTVGAIYSDMPPLERRKAYIADITYGTNNEFGFDYLRDNMKPASHSDMRFPPEERQVQRALNYAVIDEVDNILVDEARTPLIISGPASDNVERYARADKIARQLKRDVHFEVKEKEHSAHLTEEGVREAEKLVGVESFYTAGNMEWPHLIDNSLKAHHLYKLDVNYVIERNKETNQQEVIIVDEFTGRLMHGRQWSDGLHQAVEAKEGVPIKRETQTYATVTLQNFFKMYKKISGMTGTAMTEANELWKIYKLDVIAIPTNKPSIRVNHPDVIYRTEREKFEAICDEVEALNRWDQIETKEGPQLGTIVKEDDAEITFIPKDSKEKQTIPRGKASEIRHKGRPVLVGTVSIEKSERLSAMLGRRGVKHEVLNAKHHQREAEIISQAGRYGAVTIATNMAGRGTDIILGGNPETMAWAVLQHKYPSRLEVPQDEWTTLVNEIEQREKMKAEGDRVRKLGGLHVLGTERHEARRIDLQLRGRCGRQGDPGSSRFFLSLEDDLMRIFAGEWVKNVLTRLGMQEGEAIESRMVSRRIEGAQKKVEERNFEIRKNLLEYDEVMDEQRKRVYRFRQQLLDGVNCKYVILDMIKKLVDRRLDEILDRDYSTSTYAVWAGRVLGVELQPGDFRGMDPDQAERLARDEAKRAIEIQIQDAVEENLPDGEDESEWNWEALAKMVDTRWGLSLRDRDLKKVGRDGVVELLVEKVNQSIEGVDLSEGGKFLDADFPLLSVSAWLRQKFLIDLTPDELRGLEPARIKALVLERVLAVYEQKEIEYPVMAGLMHYSRNEDGSGGRVDREGLAAWARDVFQVELDVEDLRNKQRDEIREVLVSASKQHQKLAETALADVQQRVDGLFGSGGGTATVAAVTGGNGALGSLEEWVRNDLKLDLDGDTLGAMDRDTLERRLTGAVEDRYRPEIRSMERRLTLFVLDGAWKDHLLTMDHLRQSVGLRGIAQLDPKVEYRREGMKLFEQMWENIGDQVTDMVFRVEQLDDGFIAGTWNAGRATHDSPPPAAISDDQRQAIQSSENAQPIEPIRNRGPQVGRNDPCPCGSGKKYKHCHMRSDGGVVA